MQIPWNMKIGALGEGLEDVTVFFVWLLYWRTVFATVPRVPLLMLFVSMCWANVRTCTRACCERHNSAEVLRAFYTGFTDALLPNNGWIVLSGCNYFRIHVRMIQRKLDRYSNIGGAEPYAFVLGINVTTAYACAIIAPGAPESIAISGSQFHVGTAHINCTGLRAIRAITAA